VAEITSKFRGVEFEGSLKRAVLFNDSLCDEVAQKCLEAFASYGIKSTADYG
jgi:hypothetical protein